MSQISRVGGEKILCPHMVHPFLSVLCSIILCGIGGAIAGCSRVPEVLAFSPDGKLLAAAGNSNVTIWRTESGKAVFRDSLQGRYHRDPLAFTPNGSILAVGSRGIQMIMLNGKATINSLSGWEEVDDLRFCRGGRYLVSVSPGSGITRVWDMNTKIAILSNEATGWRTGMNPLVAWGSFSGAGNPKGATCSPDGKILAVVQSDAIRLYDFSSLLSAARGGVQGITPLIFEIKPQDVPGVTDFFLSLNDISFGPDSGSLFLCLGNSLVTYDLSSKSVRFSRELSCQSLSVSETDPGIIAVNGFDGKTAIWNLRTRQAPPVRLRAEIMAVAVSPEGRLLAGSTSDDYVNVWNLKSGRLSLRLKM